MYLREGSFFWLETRGRGAWAAMGIWLEMGGGVAEEKENENAMEMQMASETNRRGIMK